MASRAAHFDDNSRTIRRVPTRRKNGDAKVLTQPANTQPDVKNVSDWHEKPALYAVKGFVEPSRNKEERNENSLQDHERDGKDRELITDIFMEVFFR
jgi:hypothetical protein